jgi:hypothetical protein
MWFKEEDMSLVKPFQNIMTIEDQRTAFWRWANSQCHLRKVKLITLLVILVFIWAHLQQDPPAGIIPAVNFLLFALTAGLIFYVRLLLKTYRSALAPFTDLETDSEICCPNDEGLKFKSQRGEFLLPWQKIDNTEIHPDMILLMVKDILFCPLMLKDISKETRDFILRKSPKIKTKFFNSTQANYSLILTKETAQKEPFSPTKKLAVILTLIATPLLISSLRNSAEMSLVEKEKIRSLSIEIEKSPENQDLLRTRAAIFFAYAGSRDTSGTPPVNFVRAEPGSIFEYYHPYYLERALADQAKLIEIGETTKNSGLVDLSYIKGLGEQARRNHDIAIKDFSRLINLKNKSEPLYIEALSKRVSSFIARGELQSAEADIRLLKTHAPREFEQFIKESEISLALLKSEITVTLEPQVLAQPKKLLSPQ